VDEAFRGLIFFAAEHDLAAADMPLYRVASFLGLGLTLGCPCRRMLKRAEG
jgi:hypothetical protein